MVAVLEADAFGEVGGGTPTASSRVYGAGYTPVHRIWTHCFVPDRSLPTSSVSHAVYTLAKRLGRLLHSCAGSSRAARASCRKASCLQPPRLSHWRAPWRETKAPAVERGAPPSRYEPSDSSAVLICVIAIAITRTKKLQTLSLLTLRRMVDTTQIVLNPAEKIICSQDKAQVNEQRRP